MSFYTVLACLLAFVELGIAGYAVKDDYGPSNFFSMFDFFTDADPTHGFVSYVNQGTARSNGLINSTSQSVYLGVDYTNVTPNGRPSVRLTSKASYNHGLIILDLAHMPGSICGTWPAFWTVGPNWPVNGEVDIIEGVNEQNQNDVTLHTGPGVTITNNGKFSGKVMTSNCDINAPGQGTNAGCQIASSDTSTYGNGFNAINGGVYATEWLANQITVWFFPRGQIPSDITNGSPDPSQWSMPIAQFQGPGFDGSKFKDQQIVFDTTFCGDWAGAVWSSGSCASKAATCSDFVANNPSAFRESYWSINSLKVYQNNGASAATSSAAASTSSRSTLSVAVSSSTSSSVVASPPVASPIRTTLATSTRSSSAIVSSSTVSSATVSSATISSATVSSVTASSATVSSAAASTSIAADPTSTSAPAAATTSITSQATLASATSASSSRTSSTRSRATLAPWSWFPSSGQRGGIPPSSRKLKGRHAGHVALHEKMHADDVVL